MSVLVNCLVSCCILTIVWSILGSINAESSNTFHVPPDYPPYSVMEGKQVVQVNRESPRLNQHEARTIGFYLHGISKHRWGDEQIQNCTRNFSVLDELLLLVSKDWSNLDKYPSYKYLRSLSKGDENTVLEAYKKLSKTFGAYSSPWLKILRKATFGGYFEDSEPMMSGAAELLKFLVATKPLVPITIQKSLYNIPEEATHFGFIQTHELLSRLSQNSLKELQNDFKTLEIFLKNVDKEDIKSDQVKILKLLIDDYQLFNIAVRGRFCYFKGQELVGVMAMSPFKELDKVSYKPIFLGPGRVLPYTLASQMRFHTTVNPDYTNLSIHHVNQALVPPGYIVEEFIDHETAYRYDVLHGGIAFFNFHAPNSRKNRSMITHPFVAEPDGGQLVSIESLELGDNFECPICYDKFNFDANCIVCDNGHLLCAGCINTCADSNNSSYCPICKEPWTLNSDY
ncbi:MAG: RING finger protein [Oligoflexales bacterium]